MPRADRQRSNSQRSGSVDLLYGSEWRRKPANPTMERAAVEAIGRRRRQLLVHSAAYYGLSANLIDDKTFDHWANQLARLQKKFGWRIGFYDRAFRHWEGGSGFMLPYRDSGPMNVAFRLLRYRDAEAREAAQILGQSKRRSKK